MAISDSNAERRNLVVTATAFIVYFAAGGHAVDSTIRLAVINVSFDKPHILAVIAWTMLFWFGLRFWQTTGSKYIGAFEQEVRASKLTPKLVAHAAEIVLQNPKFKASFDRGNATIEASSLRRQGNRWVVDGFVIIINDGAREQVRNGVFEIKGWTLRWYLARAFFKHAVVDNAAADYLFPYLLFLAAVLAPWWSAFL